MKRGWMIVLLLSLGLNVGLGVNLWQRQPPAPAAAPFPAALDEAPDQAQVERFMRHRLTRLADQLELDEGQRASLWNLHRDAGREVFGHRRALRDARSRLHEAYRAQRADPQAIHAAVRRLSAMQSDLDSVVVDVMLREREFLNPDQRRRYHDLFPLGLEQHPRHRHPGQRRGQRQGREHTQ